MRYLGGKEMDGECTFSSVFLIFVFFIVIGGFITTFDVSVDILY